MNALYSVTREVTDNDIGSICDNVPGAFDKKKKNIG
jgi:hypothetical protein